MCFVVNFPAVPTIDLLNRASDGISVIAGEEIEIVSKVSGRPCPATRWTCNNVPVVTDETLTIDRTECGSILRILQVP